MIIRGINPARPITLPPNSGGKGNGGTVRCLLAPPTYRPNPRNLRRLLLDERVSAKGWDEAKMRAFAQGIPFRILSPRFTRLVQGSRISYHLTNREAKAMVVAICEGQKIDFTFIFLNDRTPEENLQQAHAHLIGAMSRYLAIQRASYLDGLMVTTRPLAELYTKLANEFREDHAFLSGANATLEEIGSAISHLNQLVIECTSIIIASWFTRYLSAGIELPSEYWEEGIESTMAGLKAGLKDLLTQIRRGAVIFLPPIIAEKAAMAAAAEFLGLAQISERFRELTQANLIPFIAQYLAISSPELARRSFALPALQKRILDQALLTFDRLKEFYLGLAQGLKFKPKWKS